MGRTKDNCNVSTEKKQISNQMLAYFNKEKNKSSLQTSINLPHQRVANILEVSITSVRNWEKAALDDVAEKPIVSILLYSC